MLVGGTSRSPGQVEAPEQRQRRAQRKRNLPLLSVLPHGPPPASWSLTQASLPGVCTRGDGHKAPTTSSSSASCQVSWQEGLLPFHFFGPFFPPHLYSKSPESIMFHVQAPATCLPFSAPNWPCPPSPHAALPKQQVHEGFLSPGCGSFFAIRHNGRFLPSPRHGPLK